MMHNIPHESESLRISGDVAEDLEKNGYVPVRHIGKGGFASCYLVYSAKYDHYFACKILTVQEDGDRSHKNTFDNEFQALTRSFHSNIIKIYNTFTTTNQQTRTTRIYLILEYCTNGDLENYIIANGPITNEQKLLQCILMMLESLRFLEANNIAHNDIKPGNFLIDEYNRLKLTDFGLAKIVDEKNPLSTDFIGSIPFLAPEIVNKKPYNPLNADVWAFGVTVFFIATGRYPFNFSSLNTLRVAQINGVVTFPPNMSAKIRSIILKCLHIHPQNRITFTELHEMVKKLVEVSPKPMVIKQNNMKKIQSYQKKMNLSFSKQPGRIFIPHYNSCSALSK